MTTIEEVRAALNEIVDQAELSYFDAGDPYEWAVLIIQAAVNSESNGDAETQDVLIGAIGRLVGAVPDEGAGLNEEEMAALVAERALLQGLVQRTLGAHGGTMSIVHDPLTGEWSVMSNYGAEAPESPMVAASAIGSGASLAEAVARAAGEAGFES